MNSQSARNDLKVKIQPPGRKRAFWIGTLFLAVLVLISAGILFYTYQSGVIQSEKIAELSAISELKVNQISQWRQERLSTARLFSSGALISSAINAWLINPKDETARNLIFSQLKQLQDVQQYQNIILTAPDGRLLLTLDPSLSGIDAESKQLAARAASTDQPIMGDFFKSQSINRILIEVAAAVPNSQGGPGAVLILRLDPELYLYPLVQSWPTPSQTAETLLVRKDGDYALFLNTLRHNPAPPLTLRIPLTSAEVPAVRAVSGDIGPMSGIDYRNVQVLADLHPIPDTGWFMVTKVDETEIMAETRLLAWVLTLVIGLFILITAALAALIMNNNQRRYLQSLYQAEQEQNKAQEEIRTTLYSIGDGVITTDQIGLVTRLNPVAEQLTGWSEDEARGKPLDQVFHIVQENTHTPVENPVERVLRERTVVGLANHTLLIKRNGEEHPIADSGSPIRDENGRIHGVVLVFRDQSKERETQIEHTILTDTLSASLNEIYLIDARTLRFRFVNQGALENLGYTLEQMQTMTPLDIKPELTQKTFYELIHPLISREKQVQVFETVHQRADGSRYPVEVHLQLFNIQGDQVFLAIILDTTERSHAEMALRKNEAFLNETQHLTGVGGWEWDVLAQASFWSDEVFYIHGFDPNQISLNSPEIIQRSLACYHPDDRAVIQAAFEQCVTEGKPYDHEARFTSALGEEKWVRTTGKPEWDQGKVVRVSGFIMDITEQHKLRESYQTLFREMLEGFALHTILCDEQGHPIDYRFEAVNPAYERQTGLKAEEIIGKTVRTILPDIEQSWIDIYGKVALTGEPAFFENYARDLDRYYEVTAFRPAPNQFACIFEESTKRKRVEKQLGEQLDELRRWHSVTLGREMRILELKREVNDLLAEAGHNPRYANLQESADE